MLLKDFNEINPNSKVFYASCSYRFAAFFFFNVPKLIYYAQNLRTLKREAAVRPYQKYNFYVTSVTAVFFYHVKDRKVVERCMYYYTMMSVMSKMQLLPL